MFFRSLILRTSGLGPIKGMVTKSSLFRPMVQRFVAGETLSEALHQAEDLAARGFNSSLDLLGENVASLEEAGKAHAEYLRIIDAIAASPHRDRINISIKLTALGLDQSVPEAENNFRTLLGKAGEHGIFVRADMESSAYTETTVAMIERVFADHPNTGTVMQSMLMRTDADLERLITLGARTRIVKGAYLEPPTVAFKDKSMTDDQYISQAKKLLERGNYPAIATHDERIINDLLAFIKAKQIPAERFEWQMLYGIRRDLQESLRAAGWNVRIYMPFGGEWYPYFTRRLAERPANLIFILKALLNRESKGKTLP